MYIGLINHSLNSKLENEQSILYIVIFSLIINKLASHEVSVVVADHKINLAIKRNLLAAFFFDVPDDKRYLIDFMKWLAIEISWSMTTTLTL